MSSDEPILFCDHRGESSEQVQRVLGSLGYRSVVSRFLRDSVETLRSRAPRLVILDPLARHGSVELQALDAARDPDRDEGASSSVGADPERGSALAAGRNAGRGSGPGSGLGSGRTASLAATNGSPPPPVPLLLVGDGELPTLGGSTLRGGPWDVIRRDAPLDEWRLRIERLEAGRNEASRVRDLAHRASHDDLTGLLRKNAFQDRLQEHFSAAQRHRFDLALVLLDLDDFGRVNKQHDHVVGDRLIQRVGDVVRRTLRTEDIAGRLGGDEFAVLLPYTRKVDAAQVVNRLRDEIRALSGDVPGSKGPIRVGTSIGFETFDGKDLESLEELRLHAERALRAAKERGGDRGVYFRSLEELAAAEDSD